MTGSDGMIQVQFDSLSAGAAQLGVAQEALTSTLEDLDRQLQTSLAEWDSQARQAYQVVRDANRQQTNHLAQVLLAMASHVSTSHEQYTSSEMANAAIWA